MALLPAAEITRRARTLRLLLFDVDGVLTDGTIVVHGDGSEAKRFSIRDGAALVWAQRAGLSTGVLSGRISAATERRAAELGLTVVVQGRADKRAAYLDVLAAHGLTDEQVAFMGDDLMDLPVIARVGLSAAPADAASDVQARVHWVSTRPGGRGAVREFIEMVLRARGEWDALVRPYTA
jgi:3-deoxy-D-manno-octulosonate 8-phosphate phosphatase (KDO 8-P phosphatase)